jgi:DNA-binding phage protein
MSDPTQETPEDALSEPEEFSAPVVLPFAPPFALKASHDQPASSTRLILDERAIARLMGTMIRRSGISIAEIADQMGVKRSAIEKRLYGVRTNPPLKWLLKLAAVTGTEITVNFKK